MAASMSNQDLRPETIAAHALRAVDEQGRELGTVAEIWQTGPVPNLVVRGAAGELVVPFADEFVPTVELEKGQLVIPEAFVAATSVAQFLTGPHTFTALSVNSPSTNSFQAE